MSRSTRPPVRHRSSSAAHTTRRRSRCATTASAARIRQRARDCGGWSTGSGRSAVTCISRVPSEWERRSARSCRSIRMILAQTSAAGAAPKVSASARRRPLAAPHQPGDRGHQLLGPLLLEILRAVDDAVARVVIHEPESDLVERRLNRGDLGQHFDAVAVFVDHVLHATDLALNAPQALEQLFFGGGVTARGSGGFEGAHDRSVLTPRGYVVRSLHRYPPPVPWRNRRWLRRCTR